MTHFWFASRLFCFSHGFVFRVFFPHQQDYSVVVPPPALRPPSCLPDLSMSFSPPCVPRPLIRADVELIPKWLRGDRVPRGQIGSQTTQTFSNGLTNERAHAGSLSNAPSCISANIWCWELSENSGVFNKPSFIPIPRS